MACNLHVVGMVGDVNLFFNDPDDAAGTVEIEVRDSPRWHASPAPAYVRIQQHLS